jgi:hypothetical protein
MPRPAPQLRSTNIPYSQLISLIKLRTNSPTTLTLNGCVTLRPEFPDHAERVPGATPLVLCTMNCTAR